MSGYPRFEVYRKAMGWADEANDERIGRYNREDVNGLPFDSWRSPYPTPHEYDFDSLEEAKDALNTHMTGADLMGKDYYILKVTSDSVSIAWGDPFVDVDGNSR